MNIQFKKSMSTVRPAEVDEISSPTVTYIRKNIKEITKDPIEGDINEEPVTFFEYDEAKLSKEEYQLYLQAQEQLQLRADIDYVILMGGY